VSGQVFISYSHKDSTFVSVLGNALIGEGYSVWFDQEALELGDHWREEIVVAIRECDAFVIVLSPNSVQSTEVTKELNLAESQKKTIFPLMLGDTEISDKLAYQLAGLQFEQFRIGQNEETLRRLVASLEKAGIAPSARERAGRQSPCFGRAAELSALDEAMSAAIVGSSVEVRLVTGSAGAGKTVLVEEFIRRSVDRNNSLVAGFGRCNSHTGLGDPYAPFKEVLGLLLGNLPETATAVGISSQNAARLGDRSNETGLALVEHAPDLIGSIAPDIDHLTSRAERLGLDRVLRDRLEGYAEANTLPTEPNQDRIQSQYVDLLALLSADSPLLIVIEDLQWADEASIELLFQLSRRLCSSPVLIVGTLRPNVLALGRDGDRHPLEGVLNEIKIQPGAITISLDAKDEAGGRAFVDALLDSEDNRLDEAFRQALVARTGGNALFTTELIQNLREQGDLKLDDEGRWVAMKVDWDTLPARTEAVLEERLSRLSEDERDLLRTASVEGIEFTAELIARVSEVDERKLIRSLERNLGKRHGLVRTAGVERRGEHWLSHYRFVQSHLQSYLYQELAPRERMMFHKDLAELLAEIYADRPEAVAPQLAWHYDRAGAPEQAVVHLMAAARRALRLCGYEEAGRHLDRALELVPELPDEDHRARTELELTIMRGTVLKARKGWAAPEVREVYESARELGSRLGADHLIPPALFVLWVIRLVKLDLEEARALSEECLSIAETLDDADTGVQASIALGNTLFWMGKLEESEKQMSRALELFDVETAAEHIIRHGQDSRVFALMFQSLIASLRGKADEANDREGEMLALARDLEHPFTSAIALQGAAWTRLHLNQPTVADIYAGQLVDRAREHGFPFYLGVGLMVRGWALAMRGEGEAGLAMLDDGFCEHLAVDGGLLFHSLYCLSKARALAAGGRHREAIEVAEQGLEVGRANGELIYEAWLMQVAIESSAREGIIDQPTAIARLGDARAVAQAQGADAIKKRIDEAIASLRVAFA
jgi:tetratricopeptide (TPR) repeat protein